MQNLQVIFSKNFKFFSRIKNFVSSVSTDLKQKKGFANNGGSVYCPETAALSHDAIEIMPKNFWNSAGHHNDHSHIYQPLFQSPVVW